MTEGMNRLHILVHSQTTLPSNKVVQFYCCKQRMRSSVSKSVHIAEHAERHFDLKDPRMASMQLSPAWLRKITTQDESPRNVIERKFFVMHVTQTCLRNKPFVAACMQLDWNCLCTNDPGCLPFLWAVEKKRILVVWKHWKVRDWQKSDMLFKLTVLALCVGVGYQVWRRQGGRTKLAKMMAPEYDYIIGELAWWLQMRISWKQRTTRQKQKSKVVCTSCLYHTTDDVEFEMPITQKIFFSWIRFCWQCSGHQTEWAGRVKHRRSGDGTVWQHWLGRKCPHTRELLSELLHSVDMASQKHSTNYILSGFGGQGENNAHKIIALHRVWKVQVNVILSRRPG